MTRFRKKLPGAKSGATRAGGSVRPGHRGVVVRDQRIGRYVGKGIPPKSYELPEPLAAARRQNSRDLAEIRGTTV